ncbi:MAG: TonB-dependent receptor [Bacteroidetes bacterium]|nr:TonB-dependent receptor [Bacteroidota bacterium]
MKDVIKPKAVTSMIFQLLIRRFPLFFTLFLFTPFIQAQDLQKKISLDLRDQPLRIIIRKISETGKIYFSYSSQSIPVDLKISVNAKNKSISEILDEVLVSHGVDYFIVENQVVLKMKNPVGSTKSEKKTEELKKYTISGFIKERSGGEVLIGANVFINGTSIGTTTNAYGFYSLSTREGDLTLVFSFIGYKKEFRNLALDENKNISIELEKTDIQIREIEVIENNREPDLLNTHLGEIKLTPKILSQIPGFVGDVDVIKALQVVPGIKSFGDGSAFFYVRGGESDQNLLLIDEAPIYNPSHLFGFVSALAPDAINDIQAYKGDFPANYGDRLSSVIDIKSKDGNMKRFGCSGNLGPYASNLSIEGPIIRDKSSFFISGRKSTLNWIREVDPSLYSFDITFFDINAKLNLLANRNNRFYLTFYWGEDMLNRTTSEALQTFGISWHNIVGTFRWNHIFSPKLFSNTTVYYSQYNYFLFTNKQLKDYWNSAIEHATVKTDFTWFLNPKNTLKAGLEASYHFSNPGNVTIADTAVQNNSPVVSKYRSLEYVLYVSNEQKIGRNLSIRYGLRIPVWQDMGPASVYYFNNLHQVSDTIVVGNDKIYSWYISPEPRIHIDYAINQSSAIKASYNRTTQFIQVLSNSTSPFTSLDVWAPCGPNILPQKADQCSIGYYQKVHHSLVNFSAELFYKWFHNHIDYKDHANMLYNPLIEGELRFGKAWSYGIEFLVRKPEGRFTGWIAYTYSRAFVQTDEVNNGHTYPAYYDRPHDLCINFSYSSGKRWDFSAIWMLLSGGTVTTPIGFYYYNGYSVPLYGNKNNDRLPPYHRLDLSVTYHINKPENRFKHSVVLTLYNAYGRYNPYSVDFNKMMTTNGDFVIPANLTGEYELVPTTISVAGIIPSINYIFKF